MSDATRVSEEKGHGDNIISLPAIEDNIRHDKAIRLEREATALLGTAGLLEVARGREHPSVQDLIMKLINTLPPQ